MRHKGEPRVRACAVHSILSSAETDDRDASCFLGEWAFIRRFPVASFVDSVFIVTRAGFEPTTLRHQSAC